MTDSGLNTWVQSEIASNTRPDLTAAKTIVSGGRALGSAEQFAAVITPLAEKLDAHRVCACPRGSGAEVRQRGGHHCGRVQVIENAALTLAPGDQQLVLVLRGNYQLHSSAGSSHTLQARHGLHWQALEEDWHAEPLGADAVMVCCAFSR